MSKFINAVRKLFSRQKTEKKEEDQPSETNEFQKAAVKAPRQYDEVNIGENGSGPVVEAEPNDVQAAPKRAPHSYDEVELNPTEDGKVEILQP